jgi:hypothetical protein
MAFKVWSTQEKLLSVDLNANFALAADLSSVQSFTGAKTFLAAVTIGVDGTGHDLLLYSASAGAFSLWDESADKQIIQGATAAGAGTLLLSTGELTNIDGGVLGRIDFQAPLDSAGTDAILVGASIWAEADATFSASVNSTELVFATAASETAAEKMRLDSIGQLGIGTATPAGLLDVRGTVLVGVDDTGHDVKFFGATAGKYMLWDESADTLAVVGTDITLNGTSIAGGTALTGSTNNTITTVTGADAIQGEANLTFDGTTLAVTGDLSTTNDLLLATGGIINFDSGDVTITHAANALTITGGIVTMDTGTVVGTLTLASGSITDSSGAVTFGNENLSTTGTLAAGATTISSPANTYPTTPTASIDLLQNGAITYGWQWIHDSGVNGNLYLHKVNAGTSTIALGFDRNAGSVKNTLDNAGFYTGAGDDGRFYHDGTNTHLTSGVGYISVPGGVIVGAASTNGLIDDASTGAGSTTLYIGNASINVTSDRRAKRNVEDFTGAQALDLVNQARVVSFDYIPEMIGDESEYGPSSRGRYVGMIAQEMKQWAPWAVNDGDGSEGDHMWKAEYDHLVGVLFAAVQAQQEQINTLKARLN